VFTAQGDMRQALNNLQSTFNGFKHVSSENVFKVNICNWYRCSAHF
jgi:replication factor C subunit 2/4